MKLIQLIISLHAVHLSASQTCYSCATKLFSSSKFFTAPGAPTMPVTRTDDCCDNFASVAQVSCGDGRCFAGTFSYRNTNSLGDSAVGFWRGCVSRARIPHLFTDYDAHNCTRAQYEVGSAKTTNDGRSHLQLCGCTGSGCNSEHGTLCDIIVHEYTATPPTTTTSITTTTSRRRTSTTTGKSTARTSTRTSQLSSSATTSTTSAGSTRSTISTASTRSSITTTTRPPATSSTSYVSTSPITTTHKGASHATTSTVVISFTWLIYALKFVLM